VAFKHELGRPSIMKKIERGYEPFEQEENRKQIRAAIT
jgi:hypothetical protein